VPRLAPGEQRALAINLKDHQGDRPDRLLLLARADEVIE